MHAHLWLHVLAFSLSLTFTHSHTHTLTNQLWDRNPDMLYNKGVTEASYVLVGSTVALSLAAGAITLSPAEKEEKGTKK